MEILKELSWTGTALLAAYFLILIAFAVAKRSHLTNPLLHLFRALFPSWRFYEDIGPMPVLFYRTAAESSDELGPWHPCFPKLERRFGALFLNATGNYRHACGSLLQHLEDEMERKNAEEIENGTPYRLTKNLVAHEIARASHPGTPWSRYQFKLMHVMPGRPDSEAEDILISPIYET